MEKFRKFADPKTGKHPYLPQTSKLTTLEIVVGLLVMIPRLLIYIGFQMVVFLKSKLLSSSSLVSTKIDQILYKIMFLLLGAKIREVNPDQKVADDNSVIYLSNFSSHFDPLILKSW